jgi:O-antigen/teichoic acid export membrane protein
VSGGDLKPFDAKGAFRPTGESGELRRRAVRSAGVTVLSQGVVFAVQMIATVVLARLLAPSDFGVVVMVTTFSLLIMSFGQNGYSEAVIQRDEIDHFLASNLFWINVGVGLLLTGIFAASGSLLARFYDDPRVAKVAVGMSLTILINSTSVVHLALLKRALQFSVTSANDIFATIVSVVLMVVLARAGWAYWALVAGALARLLSQSIGAWYLCRWMPSLPRRAAGTASVVRFALNVYGRFSFNYFTRNTDNLLVGWRFGSASLGFYKKAYDLFLLPANQLLAPVSDVVLSTLSRLERGSLQYKRYFLNGLSILAFVGMGAGAGLTLMGKDLIRLLLGVKWEAAGQIFTFFGPGIGIMLIYNASGLVHLSIGRADRWFRWVVVEFSVTVLLFFLGLHWGPVGVAAAWTASFWILTIPAFWYAGKPIQFGIVPVLATVWRYVVASLLAGCATAAVIRQIPSLVAVQGIPGALARIAVVSLLLSVLYLGAVIVLHGGTEPLYRFASLLPDMVPWARSSNSHPVTEAEVTTAQKDSLPTPPPKLRSGTSEMEAGITGLQRSESLPSRSSRETDRT